MTIIISKVSISNDIMGILANKKFRPTIIKYKSESFSDKLYKSLVI